LIDTFSFEGIHRSNAVVNFKDDDPFDPKALWLNAEYIRTMPAAELSQRLLPVVYEAGLSASPEKMAQITPLIQERIKLLRDVLTVADFFFIEQLPPYDPAELIPQKGDAGMALRALESGRTVLSGAGFTHDELDAGLPLRASSLQLKNSNRYDSSGSLQLHPRDYPRRYSHE
jgi:hypothetical protein